LLQWTAFFFNVQKIQIAAVGLFCPSAAAASFFCQSAIAAPSCCNDYMLRPDVAKGVRT
jgi:hypothetical protein